MKTVPTWWVEGPDGVVCVRKLGAAEFEVWDPGADGDTHPQLFASPKKDEAIGWAKCRVGIGVAEAPATSPDSGHAGDLPPTASSNDSGAADAVTKAAATKIAMKCSDCDYSGRRAFTPGMPPKSCTKCGAMLLLGFPTTPATLTQSGSLGGRRTLNWVEWTG